MKLKALLFALIFSPILLMGQSYEIIPKSGLSLGLSMKAHVIDFSDLNTQFANYNVGELEDGVASINLGLQYNAPNSGYAVSVDGSFFETCPDHNSDVETMALLTGFGVSVNQSYAVFQRNGWSINPTIGIGYQRLCLNVDGEIEDVANARITSFNDKICSGNMYTDFSLGFEKEIPLRHSIFLGGSLGYRKTIDSTTKTNPEDANFVDWTANRMGGAMIEFSARFEIF